MRKFLPVVSMTRGFIGAAVLCMGLAIPGLASAADPVKPDLGAGPHRDWSSQKSGEGESPRQPVSPPAVVPKANPGDASSGSSASPPSTPDDERSARDREADERKATESKDKMKKRPGYKDNVPAPRASSV
jgi:hypothetical protein